ncbi:outer membrane protein [Litoreibacter arenae]|uniref:Outer membrane protein, putative n=1 Tax=Litoreibacter arenae DSM 19593 TaxID=1123360 RepID=S9QGF3_9RHOB|nr:outer membrane beta-barrel protein [Litoreibacter arenae]EPX78947.1 outer membrane protein, putative [Litoreibacter arenae DSM 19593]
MKRILTSTAIAGLAATSLAGAAFAGNLDDAPVERPVYAPVPAPANTGGDWTGFYAGAQLGYGDADSSVPALNGNDSLYGIHAGYDYDFGRFVLGGELDYDKADIDLGGGAASIDSVARAKIRAGYDMGRTLLYATGGAARADTSVGDESGPFLGLGAAYKVTESFTVGGEFLTHQFDDVGSVAGNDIDANTFTLRGSFRF